MVLFPFQVHGFPSPGGDGGWLGCDLHLCSLIMSKSAPGVRSWVGVA
ncbi:hypothetical protein SSAG_03943 [Streptomyces sp. Mg1]|nr:hypothetical protein SSAG_03943 [Streptomyces sp. Mg1]